MKNELNENKKTTERPDVVACLLPAYPRDEKTGSQKRQEWSQRQPGPDLQHAYRTTSVGASEQTRYHSLLDVCSRERFATSLSFFLYQSGYSSSFLVELRR